METFDCIRFTIGRFEAFTYDLMYRDARKSELQNHQMPIRQGVPEQKKILTLAAATKASFHERFANVTLTHSLKSGVAVGESRASSSLPGTERRRWVKSDKKVECMADTQVEHKLASNPLGHGFTQVDIPS